MKFNLKIAVLALTALLVFTPTHSVAASGPSLSGPFDGKVVIAESFTLKSGETLTGDLLVIGGEASIEDGATVQGNLVLIGGTLVINGLVEGDVAVVGGTASLGGSAHVTGNLAVVGTTLARAETARVDGSIVDNAANWTADIPDLPSQPSSPQVVVPQLFTNFNPFRGVFNALSQAVGFAMVAMLLMLLLVPQIERVAHAVVAQPLTAGGLGLLSIVSVVLVGITLIFLPVAAILGVALFAAACFGWIVLGYELGVRIMRAFKWNWHPSLSAGLGTFVLTIGASILSGVPVLNCVGWLVPFLLTMVGLGAVIMTRFGTRVVAAKLPVEVPPPAK